MVLHRHGQPMVTRREAKFGRLSTWHSSCSTAHRSRARKRTCATDTTPSHTKQAKHLRACQLLCSRHRGSPNERASRVTTKREGYSIFKPRFSISSRASDAATIETGFEATLFFSLKYSRSSSSVISSKSFMMFPFESIDYCPALGRAAGAAGAFGAAGAAGALGAAGAAGAAGAPGAPGAAGSPGAAAACSAWKAITASAMSSSHQGHSCGIVPKTDLICLPQYGQFMIGSAIDGLKHIAFLSFLDGFHLTTG